MKASEDLFQLIKSLSKSEKRYFKLFSSLQAGDKAYLKLFDAIDRQKEYNEKELLLLFKDEKFTFQFSVAKNYLYNLILKSLESYHTSVNSELKSYLHRIEILFNKGLREQCKKIIAKAKRLAEKYEQHLTLFELLRWELELMYLKSYYGKTEKQLTEVYEQMFALMDKQKNITEYHRLFSFMSIEVFKEGFHRKEDTTLQQNKIINHVLLQDESTAHSYQSQYLFFTCMSSYNYMWSNDFQKAHYYALHLVKLIEANPHQIKEVSYQYVFAIHLLTTCQISLKKYKAAAVSIAKLKTIKTKYKYLEELLFYAVSNQELNMYIDSGQFENGLQAIDEILIKLRQFSKRTTNTQRELLLYYHVASIYFGTGDYSAANKWLNKIINAPTIDFRSDLLCFAQILHLIIHHEKYNEDLIEYRVISAQRFLKNRKQLYRFEKIILDFFRKTLPKVNTNKERINSFKTLKKEIEKITKNPLEKKALEYFDVISWVDSKIEDRAFAEVVRGKVCKNCKLE